MKHMGNAILLRKFGTTSLAIAGAMALTLVSVSAVYAASTSRFTQVINPGTLSADIVDASYTPVANPAVQMPPMNFSFACQDSVATFGTATEQIYVQNPDGADNGWTMTLAPAAASATWSGTNGQYDFNDPSGTGCDDGGDGDTYGGQMTVDPSVGTVAKGVCKNCTTADVSKGVATAFEEGVKDSVTLMSGSAASADIGDWTLQGVQITQKIPAEQLAGTDYAIDMVLSVQAI